MPITTLQSSEAIKRFLLVRIISCLLFSAFHTFMKIYCPVLCVTHILQILMDFITLFMIINFTQNSDFTQNSILFKI